MSLNDCTPGTGTGGSYIDPITGTVYTWDPSAIPPQTLTLINPGFETGDTTGWTVDVGSMSAIHNYGTDVVARSGTYMQSCLGGGSSVIFHQDLAVPSGWTSLVDANRAYLSNVGAYHNPGVPAGAANDEGRLFLIFLDGSGTQIGSTIYTAYNTIASTWTHMTLPTTLVPANTRTIRIGTENHPEDAVHDNFWDDFDNPVLSTTGGYLPMTTTRGTFVDLPATENLAAGALVSFWNNSGVGSVRNADKSTPSKEVDGWVAAAVLSGATARVYVGGINDAVSGLTPGALYFLGTGGGVTTVPTTTTGEWLQEVGKAADATHLVLNIKSGTQVYA